jgi:hypothetical protein
VSVYFRIEDVGGAVWSGTQLSVTNGSGVDVWYFDTEFSLPRASAYDVVDSIVTWHNASGRPWYGVETASWAEGTTTASGRVEVTLTSTASTTWAGSADLLTLMDWSNTTATSIGNGSTGATGTLDHAFGLTNWQPSDKSPGRFSIGGSYKMGQGFSAVRRPTIEAVLTELQSLGLSEALRVAASPRQAHVYETLGAAYRLVNVGTVSLSRGLDLYSVSVEALG